MSLSLQQYIMTILTEMANGIGFLNISFRDVDTGEMAELLTCANGNILTSDGEVWNTVTGISVVIMACFLLPDLFLYVCIIFLIAELARCYKCMNEVALARKLAHISSVYIYACLVVIILGTYIGYELLCEFNVLIFDGSYTFSMSTQILKIIMLVVLLSLYILFPTALSTKMRVLELPLLLLICAALCCTIISSTNFALLLLALEGFSLTLYIMTALGRNYGGVTASVKYFAFGTLGSIFLFWGVVHLYAIVPSLSFEVINTVLVNAYNEVPELSTALDFATTAIAFGFMLKLGAAPVHQWVADVYAGAHMYVTAFFAIFVKFVLFVVFVRVASHFNSDTLLNMFIIFSLLVGCFMSINQTEIKRLLAYSSIVHVAFLFMGDISSSLIYLLTYVSSSLIIFSVLLTIQLGGKEIIYLNDLKFIRNSGYFNTACLVIALASSAGLPPFAGFYGKFLVWSSLIEDIYLTNSSDSYIILFLSILISLVTIFYYMRLIAYLFVGDDAQSRSTDYSVDTATFNGIVRFQTAITAVLVFWTFLEPYVLPLMQFIAFCV